jgi:hypothetical protein
MPAITSARPIVQVSRKVSGRRVSQHPINVIARHAAEIPRAISREL